jgi:hypothetical protein
MIHRTVPKTSKQSGAGCGLPVLLSLDEPLAANEAFRVLCDHDSLRLPVLKSIPNGCALGYLWPIAVETVVAFSCQTPKLNA